MHSDGCSRGAGTTLAHLPLDGFKCVIVVDAGLPAGLVANASAVLGVNIGLARPDMVGPDVADASGVVHPGLTGLAIPVLRADAAELAGLAARARAAEAAGEPLRWAGFTDVGQASRRYDEYAAHLAATRTDELAWRAVAVMGEARAVRRLTSSFGLYGREAGR